MLGSKYQQVLSVPTPAARPRGHSPKTGEVRGFCTCSPFFLFICVRTYNILAFKDSSVDTVQEYTAGRCSGGGTHTNFLNEGQAMADFSQLTQRQKEIY